MRRVSILTFLLLGACGAPQPQSLAPAPEDTAFAGVDELQAKVARGELTFGQISIDALQRIEDLDDRGPRLNAILETDPSAVGQAHKLDAGGGGLLAGIPFVVKANIDTAPPMRTHAGSMAIAERVAADDAKLVRAMRNAGAILVGKANLSEWANFRSSRSVSGWSSVGGQTRNPHVLDRNPCGSSSGSAVAVAAGMVPLAIGTETHGSIVCPAGVNGIVGLKPTLGLVSRDGIVPIAASQDTAGPMARSVRDVALALQVIAQARPDASNESYAEGHPGFVDVLSGLDSLDFANLRVGVWRAYTGAEDTPRVAGILDEVSQALDGAGAQLVDPVGLYLDRGVYDASYAVMVHEFGRGLADYFAGAHTLRGIMAFNEAHADAVMPWFGQDIFVETLNSELTPAKYAEALNAGQGEMRRVLDEVFAKFQLDVIIAPTNGPAWPIDLVLGDRFSVSSSGLAAISGRPAITLPAGQIHGLPIGISMVGKMWGDAELLAMAYALEGLLPPPPRPQFTASLENPTQ